MGLIDQSVADELGWRRGSHWRSSPAKLNEGLLLALDHPDLGAPVGLIRELMTTSDRIARASNLAATASKIYSRLATWHPHSSDQMGELRSSRSSATHGKP